jgi:hypothetical protein
MVRKTGPQVRNCAPGESGDFGFDAPHRPGVMNDNAIVRGARQFFAVLGGIVTLNV